MDDAPSVLLRPESECPDDLDMSCQNTNGLRARTSKEDPHRFLERNLYGHPLAWTFYQGYQAIVQDKPVAARLGVGLLNWDRFFRKHRRTHHSCMWTITISKWQKRNKSRSIVDTCTHETRWLGITDIMSEDPIVFSWVEICTRMQNKQRYCRTVTWDWVWILDVSWRYGNNCVIQKNLKETFILGLMMRKGYSKSCVERYWQFPNKWTQELDKVATPYTVDHKFQEEDIGSVGELSKSMRSFFWNACIWLELVDVIFYWSVNMLVRAKT